MSGTEVVRVFLTDGTYIDARLVGTWDQFINQLITHSCVITSDCFANRSAITKMVKMLVLDMPEGAEMPNVIPFPDPKGSA